MSQSPPEPAANPGTAAPDSGRATGIAPAGIALAWRAFDALTVHELHAILKLRVDVFVVEQACPYAEIDGADPDAEHLLATAPSAGQPATAAPSPGHTGPAGPLLATLRVFPPSGGAPARIGRVAVAPAARGTGLGAAVMRAALERIAERHGAAAVEVSAQAHLERFYQRLGFARIGPDHTIDGIPHVDMRRPAVTPSA
ncbi:GNAT family N-acetyltransferase [Acuticoccus sediminis]|uniref:GNAT family N-acetyltransferase n=1 Tax=Acuticoccus sediminis TaxID=2184697 RepID=A0A8B2NSQ7_9HYPH|nr:GNAT family N-acetyltransferase [Acuticoccus sediminis]RAH98412.1 GNAT family N-acetyltransferase [Acuticoccus sediminis]